MPDRMAPQIKPGVSFIKTVPMPNEPFRKASRDADETIAIRRIHCFAQAGFASALCDPVGNPVAEHFGFLIQRVGDIAL